MHRLGRSWLEQVAHDSTLRLCSEDYLLDEIQHAKFTLHQNRLPPQLVDRFIVVVQMPRLNQPIV